MNNQFHLVYTEQKITLAYSTILIMRYLSISNNVENGLVQYAHHVYVYDINRKTCIFSVVIF